MKMGHWILLDELNLANQSVLEGLNACLDHRGEVYIPELDKTFYLGENAAKSTKIFATQNPYKDGSGRKGLPKSFMNRFIKVFVSQLNSKDIIEICKHRFPNLSSNDIQMSVDILNTIQMNSISKNWEFNLRDLMKFCECIKNGDLTWNLRFAQLIFSSRFRSEKDKIEIQAILRQFLNGNSYTKGFQIDNEKLKIGIIELERSKNLSLKANNDEKLLSEQFELMENLMMCIKYSWIPLIVGYEQTGKTSCVKILSKLLGQKLNLITLSQMSDTSELLGSFEQQTSTKMGNPVEDDHFKFEWVDSVLVKSVQNGDWLLIDNANLCPSSVLDRLNGLFEFNGNLVINEQGGERIIQAHPNFRVFLTVNPKFGELSNAMRNRCVEIYLPKCQNDQKFMIQKFSGGKNLDFGSLSQAKSFKNYSKILSSIFNDRNLAEECSKNLLGIGNCEENSRILMEAPNVENLLMFPNEMIVKFQFEVVHKIFEDERNKILTFFKFTQNDFNLRIELIKTNYHENQVEMMIELCKKNSNEFAISVEISEILNEFEVKIEEILSSLQNQNIEEHKIWIILQILVEIRGKFEIENFNHEISTVSGINKINEILGYKSENFDICKKIVLMPEFCHENEWKFYKEKMLKFSENDPYNKNFECRKLEIAKEFLLDSIIQMKNSSLILTGNKFQVSNLHPLHIQDYLDENYKFCLRSIIDFETHEIVTQNLWPKILNEESLKSNSKLSNLLKNSILDEKCQNLASWHEFSSDLADLKTILKDNENVIKNFNQMNSIELSFKALNMILGDFENIPNEILEFVEQIKKLDKKEKNSSRLKMLSGFIFFTLACLITHDSR